MIGEIPPQTQLGEQGLVVALRAKNEFYDSLKFYKAPLSTWHIKTISCIDTYLGIP